MLAVDFGADRGRRARVVVNLDAPEAPIALGLIALQHFTAIRDAAASELREGITAILAVFDHNAERHRGTARFTRRLEALRDHEVRIAYEQRDRAERVAITGDPREHYALMLEGLRRMKLLEAH